MEQSLFAFIWKHSKRDQFILLAVTVLSFPLLYATLELPKRIINDAIGATEPVLSLFGMEVTQLQYLGVLCFGFLLAVIASGLMKMRVNTMKGILSERLLRRFRFTLIERILRFPKPQFRRTSQGALISMVTSEAEPLGGVMGDAVAQPVFQAGQMLTILTFLFVQSPWLGLAAVALIPLQAWLIPLLQRRINLLNKARVQEVRRLAERIGESVEGVGDLRANGALRFTLADMTTRLGTLFDIRYRIYRQKFFMKFLNNFITQLTPFFFFSIGGYLAITGDLTVGALVAALAAYKDLSGPWKELLTYYNQVQDMSLRYNTIVEQFAPRGLLEAELVNGEPAELPRLTGPIELHNVSVREPDGSLLLEDISARIPAGSSVAIEAPNASERRAFAELIAREVSPASGRVTIAGSDLAGLHQSVLATRIGYAAARPQMFRGTIRDNVLMGLRIAPNGAAEASAAALEEARRTGNSTDDASCDWTDLGRIGLREADELRDWWLKLVEAMGTDGFLFDRGMDRRFDPEEHPELARRLVALRPRIAERIAEAGYEIGFHAFDREAFNPGLPVGGNLLFAIPRREISSDEMAANPRLLPAFRALGLEEKLLFLGAEIIAVLTRTFGEVGTDHPLFVRLGMDAAFFKQLVEIEAKRREIGLDRLDERMRSLLMTVPFRLSAEQIGTGFPEALRSKILDLRRTRGEALRREAVDV
ncbi:MAG: ABC transporter ATP-binding protein, partial [Pseudomonadota bacterium]